jgi:DNA-binding NtrC family response regulator
LATINQPGAHSYESERELLYKILYELRGNVSDLRRDMTSLRKQLDDARNLSEAADYNRQITTVGGNAPLAPVSSGKPHESQYSIITPQYPTKAEDAEAEEINEPETLNLSDLGRQLVEKALERNDGNRKKAALELGISDRTLYRRIKQYGLESNK